MPPSCTIGREGAGDHASFAFVHKILQISSHHMEDLQYVQCPAALKWGTFCCYLSTVPSTLICGDAFLDIFVALLLCIPYCPVNTSVCGGVFERT